MIRTSRLLISSLLLLTALFILNGCGSSKKEAGAEGQVATATKVGSESCTNTCHASTQDVTGTSIAEAWSKTTHTTDNGVQCENCHGGGSLHYGVGQISYPNPQAAQCNVCHGFTGFDGTIHANSSPYPATNFTGPGKDFFQGDAGTGQATDHGEPEYFPDGVTPVTKAQHIQECSRCHNPNQRFDFNSDGTLAKPDPNNLPTPVVSCASCHDAHQPQAKVQIAQRSSKVGYPVFRKFTVNSTGEQSDSGTVTAAVIYQPNGVVKSDGTVDMTRLSGNNNEINPDRLCAACHTKGKYKYSGAATHQEDVYTEWTESGHGNRKEPAFAEFSANPAYYDPSYPTSHQSYYPIDMAISKFVTAGPANTTQNAGNNNYACFKCHNGIASLAYQNNIQGTAEAPVIFGDATVTCITCHNPHSDVTGQTKNTRKPVLMTNYTSAKVSFSGNVFLDNTAVPSSTGNATICVFCHQGRESGYTLFKNKLASDSTLAGGFFNPHYLGTGAMLWGRNGYEYGGKMYGENTSHQNTNCTGCHMASGTVSGVGGHTWRIVSEDHSTVNSASCNTSSCHNGRVPTTNKNGEFNKFRDNTFDPSNDYDGDGVLEGIPEEIAGLENEVISLLEANGIYYLDTTYPYFFSDSAKTKSFTAWTLPTFKAAFNLAFVIKGLPSGASQIGQPNTSAAVHNFRYNIQLLRDSYDDLQKNGVAGQTDRSSQPRPSGTRTATNYDPQANGGYNSRQ